MVQLISICKKKKKKILIENTVFWTMDPWIDNGNPRKLQNNDLWKKLISS